MKSEKSSLFLVLFLLAACTHESSSGDTPATTSAAPSASVAPAPSASASTTSSATAAAPTAKPTSGAPSTLPFCKGASYANEPLLGLCAVDQDWSKAHFECAKPLPRDFCGDLSVWGCQYVASAGEKAPKVTFFARFVRGGVAPEPGEIIDDNSLRARFPRAGNVRGVTVKTAVAGADEAAKLVAAETKKLTDAGCVVVGKGDTAVSNRLECGSWQARVSYDDKNASVIVDADSPKTPDCSK